MNRRQFLTVLGVSTLAGPSLLAAPATKSAAPSYLKDHAELYGLDPKAAALAWFKEARFGLFMHYGLFSILGRGASVMFNEAIPVAEYEKLKPQFHPDKFDADFITDLALEAGMKYVNLTSRHCDSFCLFDSKHSDYTSARSPAKRDLVGELAGQCRQKGLGLFLYYAYAMDWRHPYFYPRQYLPAARPDYKQPEPSYRWKTDADFGHYLEFVHGQLRELLTNYGPLAGIWLDPIIGYYARPNLFPIHETYALIRGLQPQTLISFKQGATGTEDFAAPERYGRSLADTVRKRCGEDSAKIAAAAWQANQSKHNELCDTMQPRMWGYVKEDEGKHLDASEVRHRLALAFGQNCNLLMNTGPLPDGSIHPTDLATFREVGRRIRAEGYPAPATEAIPATGPKKKAQKPAAPAE